MTVPLLRCLLACCLALTALPAALAAATVWHEADGVLIMEAERGTPESSDTWDIVTDYPDYRGVGFIRWEGSNKYNSQSHGVLSYTFTITNPGTYHMSFRAQAKGPDYGERNDEANDCWVQRTVGSSNYYKFHVGGKSTKDWHFNMRWERNGGHDPAVYELDAGQHTFVIAARSEKFMIDRLYFVQDKNDYDPDLPESASDGGSPVTIGGDLQQWHRVDLALAGPESSVSASVNPFRDQRFNVTFTSPGGDELVVPGYFAGDGAGGDEGNTWMAHLNPHETGTWQYETSFRSGPDIAVSLDPAAGSAVGAYDGVTGTFQVTASDKSGADFRAPDNGLLVNRGHHYLTYGGSGDPFLYTGPGIPENILGYRGFHNTSIGVGHEFTVHESDWNSGDPDWDGGAGKALIGALNYIADEGANSLYMMSNTIGGDGEDCFPHPTSTGAKDRYDLLKLQQWDIALSHAQARGIFLHWHLAEHETANMTYYGASLSTERKLYFRMLVSRFGHYNGLKWNLMEECEWNASERSEQLGYLKAIDPYDHPCTYQVGGIGIAYDTYESHYGDPNIDSGSFQGGASRGSMFNTVQQYRQESAAGGEPWTIAWDEPQKIENDNTDEADGYPMGRRDKMWPCLMAGGDGFLWYIQKDGGGHGFDQRIEDFTIMQNAFNWSGHARAFLEPLPLLQMQSSRDVVAASDGNDYCLFQPGEVYAIYNDRVGSGMSLDLTGESGIFTVRWFDPRTGGVLQSGSVTSVSGGSEVDLGEAPAEIDQDWAVLVERAGGTNQAPQVAAGADQTITPGQQASLDGTVSDDGLPVGGTLTTTWQVISGPDAATIADAGSVDTTVGFTGTGTWVFELAASDGELTTSDRVSITVQPDQGDVVLAVNAGGPAYTAGDGTVYQADTGFSGGATFTSSEAISGTDDDELYQSERYGDFSYQLAVPDGDYVLTVHLAELFHDDADARVFDLIVEGATAQADIDLIATAGKLTAHDVTIPVTISDGQFDLTATASSDNPKVSGFRLSQAATNAERTITVQVTRGGAPVAILPSLDPDDDDMPSMNGERWTFDTLMPGTDYRVHYDGGLFLMH